MYDVRGFWKDPEKETGLSAQITGSSFKVD